MKIKEVVCTFRILKLLASFLICLILFQGCNKNSNQENAPSNSNCQLNKIIWIAGNYDFTDGTPIVNTLLYNDSVPISMTGDNGNSYQYVWDIGLLFRRNYYRNGQIFASDSITYSGAHNSVVYIAHYSITNGNENINFGDTYNYDQNNRLIKIDETTWVDQNGNAISPTSNGYPFFYYDNNGDLNHVVRYSANGNKYLEYYYSYTNQPNYLATKFKNLRLIDFGEDTFSRIFYDVMYTSPLLLKTIHYIVYNDQDSSKVKEDKTINISYDLNKPGYPTLIKADGESVIGFEYDCK